MLKNKKQSLSFLFWQSVYLLVARKSQQKPCPLLLKML